MRLFQIILLTFIAVVVSSCMVFHLPITQRTNRSRMLRDYAATRFDAPFTPIRPEQIRSLPKNTIIAFRGDDEVEIEQIVRHQRLYSGKGFSNFAIMDKSNALIPVIFYGFAENHFFDNGECQTFLVTTNEIVLLSAFTKGIGENSIPTLPEHKQEINFSDLDVKTPVEIVCQGCVPVSILLERLKKLNPEGNREVYLLYY